MAFGLGLIPYSVQYVVLRGFYAYEDTRTPFFNTVIVATVNAVASGLCFAVLSPRWAVAGIAASYGLAYAVVWELPGADCAGAWAATWMALASYVPTLVLSQPRLLLPWLAEAWPTRSPRLSAAAPRARS